MPEGALTSFAVCYAYRYFFDQLTSKVGPQRILNING